LQSQIDLIAECCPDRCCLEAIQGTCELIAVDRKDAFSLVGSVTNQVESVDWSVNDSLIALGLVDRHEDIPNEVLKIYSYTGSSVVERDSKALNGQNVTSVRWHPTRFCLAVSTLNSPGVSPELMIFDVDPLTGIMGATPINGGINVATDVFAISWHPSGDYLAVGRDVPGSQVAIYKVDANCQFVDLSGTVTTEPIATIDIGGQFVERQALDWDATGRYLVVGLNNDLLGTEIRVFDFNAGVPALTLNASLDLDQSVHAVDWNQKRKNLIAAGFEGNFGNLLRVYEHNPLAGTLTEKVTAAVGGLGATVRSVDWTPRGDCLAIGRNVGLDGEFRTYHFDHEAFTLEQISTFEYDDVVESVRWSREGCDIANGTDEPSFSVFHRLCNFDKFISRIEVLETCCDSLRTSTGFLQSQIDAISTDTVLTSRVEVLETCCDALRTSTGFLQSQIDAISTSTTLLVSRVEVLETCCDALRTSTGFLQSQIDAISTDTVLTSRVEVLETC